MQICRASWAMMHGMLRGMPPFPVVRLDCAYDRRSPGPCFSIRCQAMIGNVIKAITMAITCDRSDQCGRIFIAIARYTAHETGLHATRFARFPSCNRARSCLLRKTANRRGDILLMNFRPRLNPLKSPLCNSYRESLTCPWPTVMERSGKMAH